MSVETLEKRMMELEAEVAQLKRQVKRQRAQSDTPWWERRFGSFKDDPMYDEAARLGAEYRKSQPTPADEDVSA